MAKNKKDVNPQTISNVEQTLTRTEQFLEENYDNTLGLAVIICIVGLGWLGKMYLGKRNDEALSQMYQAEGMMDSLRLALNGDGNYIRFLILQKATDSQNRVILPFTVPGFVTCISVSIRKLLTI